MTRTRMILGYGFAVVLLMGVAGRGYTGDHGGTESGNTVCQAVPSTKAVKTKTYSSKWEDFCQTPLGLFGTPSCGPVRTKKLLVLHVKTKDVPTTKYIPTAPCAEAACAEAACPPTGYQPPTPGAALPPGTMMMPSGQFPALPPGTMMMPSGQFPAPGAVSAPPQYPQ